MTFKALSGLMTLILVVALAGCIQVRDDHPLCEGLATGDRDVVADWIDHYASDLDPVPVSDDPVGHEANMEELLDRLNGLDCLSATLGCYACIRTLPPKSEVILRTGHVQRTIFLRTGNAGPMRFAGWRE